MRVVRGVEQRGGSSHERARARARYKRDRLHLSKEPRARAYALERVKRVFGGVSLARVLVVGARLGAIDLVTRQAYTRALALDDCVCDTITSSLS